MPGDARPPAQHGRADLDLDAYLRQVGLPAAGDLAPTVQTLRRLHRAHVDVLAFTSVTTALGRVPALDLPTVQRRMVTERRGGYCLEHVTLFAAVLDALDFAPALRLCRVGDPAAERVDALPPTHLTVLARPADDRRRWMTDVGFGVGVLGPVPVPVAPGAGEPVGTGAWEHRVDVEAGRRIVLLERGAAGWRPLHATVGEAPTEPEIAEANRWVALQPRSPFAGRLVAMRTTEEQRERLVGARLELTVGRGEPRVEQLTPAGAVAALGHRFGIAVDEADQAALRALLEREGAASSSTSPTTADLQATGPPPPRGR